MSFLKIRAEEEDLRKWKERATAAGMDFSKWVRAMLNMASVENKAGAVQPTKKNSKRTLPPIQQSVAAAATDLCSHDYGPLKCPIPGCKYYKWRK